MQALVSEIKITSNPDWYMADFEPVIVESKDGISVKVFAPTFLPTALGEKLKKLFDKKIPIKLSAKEKGERD